MSQQIQKGIAMALAGLGAFTLVLVASACQATTPVASDARPVDAPARSGGAAPRVEKPVAQAVPTPTRTPLQIVSRRASYDRVSPEVAREKGCLSCHDGIEDINPKMTAAWGADRKCEVCHKGQPQATTKDEAHRGMYANPGDLRVVSETCGQCHDDAGVIRRDVEGLIPGVVRQSRVVSAGERNHVPRVLRSLMATAAGEIAATRFLWGAQDSIGPLFATRPISAINTISPTVAIGDRRQGVETSRLQATLTTPFLQQLPPANYSDADNLLRNFCLKCHLWTEGEPKPGLHRSSGCSACHVIYEDDGLSKSGDATIPKNAPSHPAKHQITAKVPTAQCLRCHNDGGGRLGLNFVGLIPAHASATPLQPDGSPQAPKFGINTLPVRPDVHFEKGMHCIDCHTSKELHGDGNLYARKENEVRISCETCHGTTTSPPTLADNQGEPLKNLYRSGAEVVLVGKIDGQRHFVTQLDKVARRGSLPLAMRIPAHVQEPGTSPRLRLECSACHSRSTPQCFGCHLKRDDRQMAPVDWVAGIGEGVEPKPSQGLWSGELIYTRWEDPPLGVNSRGRVSPFVPGGQVLFSRIGPNGEVLSLNQALEIGAGSGGKALAFAMNPISPHATTKQARSCESCHSNPRALGLGSEVPLMRERGWNVDLPFDRMVDEEGRPTQLTTHERARPFDKAELERIDRTSDCMSCHKDMDNAQIWEQVVRRTGQAKTPRDHQDIINWIFKGGALNGPPAPSPASTIRPGPASGPGPATITSPTTIDAAPRTVPPTPGPQQLR
ncbi:MAG: hypothetical protein HY675_25765 [Chloroflexi bacterium]|nr:hypothetical protein [Chloroflexota bacterium]